MISLFSPTNSKFWFSRRFEQSSPGPNRWTNYRYTTTRLFAERKSYDLFGILMDKAKWGEWLDDFPKKLASFWWLNDFFLLYLFSVLKNRKNKTIWHSLKNIFICVQLPKSFFSKGKRPNCSQEFKSHLLLISKDFCHLAAANFASYWITAWKYCLK